MNRQTGMTEMINKKQPRTELSPHHLTLDTFLSITKRTGQKVRASAGQIGSIAALFLFLAFASSFFWGVRAQEVKSGEEGSVTIGNFKLSLEEAVNMVIRKNLTLRKAKYDVLMADTDLLKYEKKFAANINAEAAYEKQTVPLSGTGAAFGGDETTDLNASLSIAKLFSTGTMLQAGIRESLYDQNDSGFPTFGIDPDPAYHKPSLFINIQQEILKNAFGYGDRQTLKLLEGQSEIKRDALINQLSGLVVETLVQYWQVVIEKSAVSNAEVAKDSTRQIRDIVARNTKIGLAEDFDLNQYNSLLYAADSQLEITRKSLTEASRKLLRMIDMPADTKIEGVTELIDVMPELNGQAALEAAFSKRIDYKNALKELELAQINLSLARTNALPSVALYFNASALSQAEAFSDALGDAMGFQYPVWAAGVKLSYPLGDHSITADLRNAHFRLRQAEINLEELKKEIRDDVLDKMDAVRVQHEVLLNSRQMLAQSEMHYSKVLARARTGRFNAVVVKNALDALIDARQRELESLVRFNIALLQFDLAKNEIFERYKIDIDRILREVE